MQDTLSLSQPGGSSALSSSFAPPSDKDLNTFEGVVQSVLFVAANKEFAILRLEVPLASQPVIAVGALAHAKIGETLQVSGTWEVHAQHGKRFRVVQAFAKLPVTLLGIERYLTTLRGFGPESARRLVVTFGLKTLEILENETWRVAQLKGIGKRRAIQAASDAKNRREEREIMVFLQGYGISAAYASRIRKIYGALAISKVHENPYRLAKEVPGIGFQIADQMAKNMGISLLSPLRLEAAILYCLERASDAGHCYLPKEKLLERTLELVCFQARRPGESLKEQDVRTPPASRQQQIQEAFTAVQKEEVLCALGQKLLSLQDQGEIIIEDERIFRPPLFQAEIGIARRLTELCQEKRSFISKISELPKDHTLSQSQLNALSQVLASPISIITGGPGTGKTTLVRTLVRLFEKQGRRVLLLAPTGRASKRLTETTGREASTIHRALAWNPQEKFPQSKVTLDADLIVCDEASMMDVQLCQALLQAVPLGAMLVFVGDVDQLPSVGPGKVLEDIIRSGKIPVARLVEVFRQAEGSLIIQNAHQILKGQFPNCSNNDEKYGDFYILDVEDPKKGQELVLKLCTERIPRRFGLNPIEQIQVLTPMHRGEIGTESLNQSLQEILNPQAASASESLVRGDTKFFAGDKVMQIKNDYERDVWNGDTGIVTRVHSSEQQLWVRFDERLIPYKQEQLEQLELAYAISVHKSQGSEYPAVILPLFLQHFPLLKRNLLYTAVTRGKNLVVILGSRRVILKAIQDHDATTRYTSLADKISLSRVADFSPGIRPKN